MILLKSLCTLKHLATFTEHEEPFIDIRMIVVVG